MAEDGKVSREELVAELKRRFAADGYPGISGLIEKMLTEGQQHQPEWVACKDCGADIERSNNPTQQQIRCDPCRRDMDNEVVERWKDGWFGS